MNTLRSKACVTEVTRNVFYETAHMVDGYDRNNAEDKAFSEVIPCLKIEITVDNSTANGFFKPGKKYYVEFTEAAE